VQLPQLGTRDLDDSNGRVWGGLLFVLWESRKRVGELEDRRSTLLIAKKFAKDAHSAYLAR
jgi:hypothetical protein